MREMAASAEVAGMEGARMQSLATVAVRGTAAMQAALAAVKGRAGAWVGSQKALAPWSQCPRDRPLMGARVEMMMVVARAAVRDAAARAATFCCTSSSLMMICLMITEKGVTFGMV